MLWMRGSSVGDCCFRKRGQGRPLQGGDIWAPLSEVRGKATLKRAVRELGKQKSLTSTGAWKGRQAEFFPTLWLPLFSTYLIHSSFSANRTLPLLPQDGQKPLPDIRTLWLGSNWKVPRKASPWQSSAQNPLLASYLIQSKSSSKPALPWPLRLILPMAYPASATQASCSFSRSSTSRSPLNEPLHASLCLECYSSKYPLRHYSNVTFSKRSSLRLYRKFHLPHLSLCYFSPLRLSTSNILYYIFDCCVYLLLPFHQNLSPGKTGTFVCSVHSFITSSLNNAWHRGSA